MTQLIKSNGSSTLAILDIRDREKEKGYLEFRLGLEEADAEEKVGHLLYEKEFFSTQLKDLGFERVVILDSVPSQYGNARFSYNVYATGLLK